jgi:hypothetical protein
MIGARGPFDFDVSKLSVEEVKERLRAAGLPVDAWVSNEDHVKEGDKARLPTFEHYAKLLEHLRDIMQKQADQDLQQIDDLNYQLQRLQHGGGR